MKLECYTYTSAEVSSVDPNGKVLVIGGSGFVGANVLNRLIQDGIKAIGFDVALPPPILNHKIKVVKGDMLDLPHLLHTINHYGIKGIIHTSAIMPSTGSEVSPTRTMRINVEGTLNVLEAARLAHLKRVVFCSTVAACGSYGLVKVREDDPPKYPFGWIYGLSKFTAEQICVHYLENFGVDVVTVRFTNVFGPGQRPFRKPFIAGAQMIDWFVQSAVKEGKIELDGVRDTEKDFTYVSDVVEGVLLAYEKEKLQHRLFNISSGKLTSTEEIIDVIAELLPNVSINVGPGVEEVLPYFDISRAEEELGYHPKYDLKRAITEYIEWLKSQPQP